MKSNISLKSLYSYGNLSNYQGLEGKFPIRNPDLYFGIEVEAEKIRTSDIECAIPGSWKAIQDGSLKVNGMEFVTVPIKFKYLEIELRRLFSAIPKASFSCRTSIHVHMNARDMTLDELMVFLTLYMIFEKSLYVFSGNRWKNNFCSPLYFNPKHTVPVITGLNEGYLRDEWQKYYGLNLTPIYGMLDVSARLGTIEFRHMEGNNDVERILNWCSLISSLKNSSKTLQMPELLDIIMSNNTMPLGTMVFGKWFNVLKNSYDNTFSTTNGLEDDLETCTSKTKHVLHMAGIIKNDIEVKKAPLKKTSAIPVTMDEILLDDLDGLPSIATAWAAASMSSSFPNVSQTLGTYFNTSNTTSTITTAGEL